MNLRELLKLFMGFALISGVGWLCDFGTYVVLIQWNHVDPFWGNMISSYVGVTFVYATSLRLLFNKTSVNHSLFLSLYWGYQFVSILIYSAVLKLLVQWLLVQPSLASTGEYAGTMGKIIVTPFNLLSNFIFMKFLTRFMKDAEQHHA